MIISGELRLKISNFMKLTKSFEDKINVGLDLTLIVLSSLEYDAATIVGVEPSKSAMKSKISQLESELQKIRKSKLFRILKYFILFI